MNHQFIEGRISPEGNICEIVELKSESIDFRFVIRGLIHSVSILVKELVLECCLVEVVCEIMIVSFVEVATMVWDLEISGSNRVIRVP